MTQGVSDIYTEAMKTLAAPERLELASMLLQSIPPQSVADYSEEWTEDDMREFSAHCRSRLVRRMEDDEQSAS